jgi:hypothetical protein
VGFLLFWAVIDKILGNCGLFINPISLNHEYRSVSIDPQHQQRLNHSRLSSFHPIKSTKKQKMLRSGYLLWILDRAKNNRKESCREIQ